MNDNSEQHEAISILESIENNADLIRWCVHILGPDDILAAPSHRAAEARALAINKATFMQVNGSNDVLCFAYAAPWPHDEDSYKENLKDWK